MERVKTHELCTTIFPFNIKINGFSDLTGAFPHKSSRGNLYDVFLYDYDSNTILAEPNNNNQAATIRDTFLRIHNILKSIGSNPKVYIMGGECSSDLKEAMKKYTIDFQLAPPHMQRLNTAERYIRPCNNHFIYGIATIDPYFPIIKWYRLLPK